MQASTGSKRPGFYSYTSQHKGSKEQTANLDWEMQVSTGSKRPWFYSYTSQYKGSKE